MSMKNSKEYDKKWRKKNPEKVREYKKKQYQKYRRMLHELKINGCALCGYDKCPDALSFHHVNSKDKKFCVCITNLHCKDRKIIDEINKCILLCANCHWEIHYKKQGSEKYGKL